MKYKLLKRGDKVTYTKTYMYGKWGQETATVVMLKGSNALLDNGDTVGKYMKVGK